MGVLDEILQEEDCRVWVWGLDLWVGVECSAQVFCLEGFWVEGCFLGSGLAACIFHGRHGHALSIGMGMVVGGNATYSSSSDIFSSRWARLTLFIWVLMVTRPISWRDVFVDVTKAKRLATRGACFITYRVGLILSPRREFNTHLLFFTSSSPSAQFTCIEQQQPVSPSSHNPYPANLTISPQWPQTQPPHPQHANH